MPTSGAPDASPHVSRSHAGPAGGRSSQAPDRGAAVPPSRPQDTPPPTEPGPARPTAASTDDVQAVWEQVQEIVRQRPSMVWVERNLVLDRLESAAVHLGTRPGMRDVRSFLSDRQRDQLAQVFESILGRRVRVVIEPPAAAAGEPVEPVGTSAPSSMGPQAAMQLPLVNQLMREFGASIVNVRPESQPAPAPTTPADQPAASYDDADFGPGPEEMEEDV